MCKCVYKIDNEYYCKYPSAEDKRDCPCLGDPDLCPFLAKGARGLDKSTTRILDEFWKPFIDNCNQHFS